MNIVRKVLEHRKAALAPAIIVLRRQLHREPAHKWIVARIFLEGFRSVLQHDQRVGGTLGHLSAMGFST